MARVGRLAGAILAETGGDYYLVGHPKVPCDWRASGFEPPCEITGVLDASVTPVVRLALAGAAPPAPTGSATLAPTGSATPALGSSVLVVETEGEALARLLAAAFVIQRTGSVSERLWRLATGQSDDSDAGPPDVIDLIPARWLGELPPAIWQIVRDSVLRCT